MLDKHTQIGAVTTRARFVNTGNASQEAEIFAYVFAADSDDFLGIQYRSSTWWSRLAFPIEIAHKANERRT
jgi:hypothetical protein